MKQELLCVTSDSANRYGMVVTTEAMEKSLKETYDLGVPILTMKKLGTTNSYFSNILILLVTQHLTP